MSTLTDAGTPVEDHWGKRSERAKMTFRIKPNSEDAMQETAPSIAPFPPCFSKSGHRVRGLRFRYRS